MPSRSDEVRDQSPVPLWDSSTRRVLPNIFQCRNGEALSNSELSFGITGLIDESIPGFLRFFMSRYDSFRCLWFDGIFTHEWRDYLNLVCTSGYA